ncbi:hypothetical protein [Nocardia sp. NPDC050710]|uniref:hypothetical protein n=1 Tax=Nocardia sp. NPDC050710 TaxID=3157220 RepID=UPI0033CA1268
MTSPSDGMSEPPVTCSDFVRAALAGDDLPRLSAAGEVLRLQSVAALTLRAAVQEAKYYQPERREQYQYDPDPNSHWSHPERMHRYEERHEEYNDWLKAISHPQLFDREPLSEQQYATIRHQVEVENLFSRWAVARAIADRDPALSSAWDERMRSSGADLEAIEAETMRLVAADPIWHDLPASHAEVTAINDTRGALDHYQLGLATPEYLAFGLREPVPELVATAAEIENRTAASAANLIKAAFPADPDMTREADADSVTPESAQLSIQAPDTGVDL